MAQFSTIRGWLERIKATPLHPQWLIYRHQRVLLKRIGAMVSGMVLDIGSGRQTVRPYLSPKCRYIPLDYYDTAVNWYEYLPEVFADAQVLPIQDESVDAIIILDVLEHLPRPEECLVEMYRVLKPGGRLIIQVPFIYPIHDAPLDFHRWTRHGLQMMGAKHNFTIEQLDCSGIPVETGLLLLNLAICKAVLNWMQSKNPLVLLGLLLPPVILLNHMLACLSQIVTSHDDFMPLGYQLILIKD